MSISYRFRVISVAHKRFCPPARPPVRLVRYDNTVLEASLRRTATTVEINDFYASPSLKLLKKESINKRLG